MRIGSIHFKRTTFAILATAVLVHPGTSANSEDMQFNTGPISFSERCIIEVQQEGTFGTSPNLRVLNSQNFGGIGAQIRVTSIKRSAGSSPGARYRITLEPPSSFTVGPPGADANVNWRTRFTGTSVSNGVNFGMRNGTRARRLPRAGTSVTQVTGHLRARKTTGIFPAGTYRAEALFRCE